MFTRLRIGLFFLIYSRGYARWSPTILGVIVRSEEKVFNRSKVGRKTHLQDGVKRVLAQQRLMRQRYPRGRLAVIHQERRVTKRSPTQGRRNGSR